MQEANRITLMQDAAKAVLGSLTVIDRVNVVTFNTVSETFRCAKDGLLRATPDNIRYLQEQVDALRPGGQVRFTLFISH